MSTAASPLNSIPTLSFRLNGSPSSSKFSPRLGRLCLTRPDNGAPVNHAINIELLTPGLMTSTNRGVIQHLSRDNVKRTPCIKWVHVPFESFLQVDPPIPTQQKSIHPLHTFLGFSPSQHVLSLSLRDAADGREMPSNGKLFLAAQSSRGTRKVTCSAYRSYVTATLPDIVFSMSDVPFNSPPHSQKRISKSIERSAQWLTTIIVPIRPPLTGEVQDNQANDSTSENLLQNLPLAPAHRLNVFVHMVGGIKSVARSAFARALLDPLEPKDKELTGLETLDEGVSGYVFDLVPMRTALLAEQSDTMAASHLSHPSPSTISCSVTDSFAPLIRASLQHLPESKPRLVNTAYSPHEMLRLIRDTGVDLFDTYWAQQAATWGVALDFRFPIPSDWNQRQAPIGEIVKHQIGHNLYEERFAHDFTSLTGSILNGLQYSKRQQDPRLSSHIGNSPTEHALCSCAACSPMWSNHPLVHCKVDDTELAGGAQELASPYTRAYVHHLLHTHEMSAHALLVMHNLTVMDTFMSGVRSVLEKEQDVGLNGSRPDDKEVPATETHKTLSQGNNLSLFAIEVGRFERIYDAGLSILDEARTCWADVDLARGKGRLARERAKALENGMGTRTISTTADVENHHDK